MPRIKVSFYDEKNRELLETTPKYKVIKKLVEEGFDYSNEDLWTYGLFREQKPIIGFNNFEQLKSKLPTRLGYIEDYFDISADIVWRYEDEDLSSEQGFSDFDSDLHKLVYEYVKKIQDFYLSAGAVSPEIRNLL